MNRECKDPIKGLDEDELALLVEALKALRAKRGKAWNTACDVAEAAHKRPPSLKMYGIDDIRRLVSESGMVILTIASACGCPSGIGCYPTGQRRALARLCESGFALARTR